MNLPSVAEFVLDKAKEYDNNGGCPKFNFKKVTTDFAEIMTKVTVRKGMFIPCNKQDEPLQALQYCCSGNPEQCGCRGLPVNVNSMQEIDEYYEAEEKVLFKDCEYIGEDPKEKGAFFVRCPGNGANGYTVFRESNTLEYCIGLPLTSDGMNRLKLWK